jgi:hypothetical protein
MDTKLTVVGDSEFEMLARLGDHESSGTGDTLTRIEGDVLFIVCRQSLWDLLEDSKRRVESECAGREIMPFQKLGES